MDTPRTAHACAPSNIALVKYWGKRGGDLNLPQTGSISVTLEGLASHTSVTFEPRLREDVIVFEGKPVDDRRVARFLDVVRRRHGVDLHATVRSHNDFPTGAGLASSASGFAALAVACDAALGLGLSREELSVLARLGSGSAARSLVDGYAEMHVGEAPDGSDAFATQLAPADALPLEVLVAVTTRARKEVGSTEGMQRTAATSPFYPAWIETTRAHLEQMRAALARRDLPLIGEIAERNCLCMHATMLGAGPPLLYWNAGTVAVMHAVQALRREDRRVWFTIDAGPQVKVLCDTADADAVAAALERTPGVQAVLRARPGRGAHVVEETA